MWTGAGVILLVTVFAILYGQGQLNFGALSLQPGTKKVSRVAEVQCPDTAVKETPYCVFNLDPLEYYVVKDGSNFLIYGPNVTDIFKSNNWNFVDGRVFNGAAYSIANSGFTDMKLNYKLADRNGKQVPAFVFDYSTAQKIQGSRFVEVALPNSIKIRFNTFNIPDKTLNNK